nr:hypothetical protein [Duncaniella sp.]
LWWLACYTFGKKVRMARTTDPDSDSDDEIVTARVVSPALGRAIAIGAFIIGLLVPLQMVSQTWDDHDRSGRYTTRDFGFNYLNSLDENAIIFTNGDNDTFPLWYAQEVEGERTDVKVVNLSYLTTDWYADQIKHPSYGAAGVDMMAQSVDYAYNRLQFSYFSNPEDSTAVNLFSALEKVYDKNSDRNAWHAPMMPNNVFSIPVDASKALEAGRITAREADLTEPVMIADLGADPEASKNGGVSLSQLLSLDIIGTSVKNGWKRPVYFASTVPTDYYVGMQPYLRSTGMAYEVSPVVNPENSARSITAVNTDKAYRNINERFRWGGLDKVTEPGQVYLDETVRRMVTTTRSFMIDCATALVNEAVMAERVDTAALTPEQRAEITAFKADRYEKALNMVELLQEKLPAAASPYAIQTPQRLAQLYTRLAYATGNMNLLEKSRDLLKNEIDRYAGVALYQQSLAPWQRATLQNNDLYASTYYIVYLLQDYQDAKGDAEALISEMEERGVDFDRIVSVMDR